MDWTIAPYEQKQVSQLRLVYKRARQSAFPSVEPSTFKLLDFDIIIQDETVLVATQHTVPIGFIAWWPPNDFIHSLFVDPSFSRNGVGKSLLQACLAEIGRPATLKCKVANEPALHFYYAQGWHPIGEAEDSQGPYLLLAFNQ